VAFVFRRKVGARSDELLRKILKKTTLSSDHSETDPAIEAFFPVAVFTAELYERLRIISVCYFYPRIGKQPDNIVVFGGELFEQS
jgi:hypothetical protein